MLARGWLPAALLLVLASLAAALPWAWPAESLHPRQLAVPPPNDYVDYYRPANMTEFDATTWTLGTREMVQNAYQVQPYVANGYHGSRLTVEGLGYWVCPDCGRCNCNG